MKNTTILLSLLLVLTASLAYSGQMHPRLEARLEAARADEVISIIVHMIDQAPIATMNRQLKTDHSTLRDRHEQVIDALKLASRSQESLKEYLDEKIAGGTVSGYTSHWISNLIVVAAKRDEVDNIAHHPDVDYVELNFQAELIEPFDKQAWTEHDEMGAPLRGIGVTPGLQAIRAPEVWHTLGITGLGTLIGSCDTGVDGNHPALSERWRGNYHPWQECWLDVLGTATTFPNDGDSHGTHTTGTMTGVAPDDTIGVAWEAEWIAANVINQGVSSAFDNDVITCYEWFADPDGDPGTVDDVPDVVQNSWRVNESFPGDYTDCDSRWWSAIDNAEAAGIVTVWSAGNEGSGSQTIGSPADRATTLTNAFSVGAVDATNYGWPYPIAGFSSRGPTGCPVAAENRIKPEVVAPGVDVYSSVPGGGYEGTWDGTSMSGPHVAGTVALIRQANPNLDVDTIKELLMSTARDEGTAGEDNVYGHGMIDAYEAVLAATVGFGTIEGTVRNRSYGNAPIPGARIEIIGYGYNWGTTGDGTYTGSVEPGSFMARASHAGFSTLTRPVEIVADEITTQNFRLTDIAGPTIKNVSGPAATSDVTGPYTISAKIVDYSSVSEATLYYRVNGGNWSTRDMTSSGGDIYEEQIPGAPANSRIDYYIFATDGLGLMSTKPGPAPNNFYSIYITESLYAYDVEDPVDNNWQLGVAGDDATTGIWVRVDPNGTNYGGVDLQPEDDHTEAPGTLCFVTGQGSVGGSAGENDVDNGCTTLRSPVFDLSDVETAFIRYWRWYGEGGSSIDDEFAVDISDDGGFSWSPAELVPATENQWKEVTLDVGALLGGNLTSQVVVRFVACDENAAGLVEGAIDDFALETYTDIATDVAATENARTPVRLMHSRPNPFRPASGSITISFSLPKAEHAEVQIFDVTGRLVRNLADRNFAGGDNLISWDGRDEAGKEVGSGVYFYRLKTGSFEKSRRLTVLR